MRMAATLSGEGASFPPQRLLRRPKPLSKRKTRRLGMLATRLNGARDLPFHLIYTQKVIMSNLSLCSAYGRMLVLQLPDS
jgi:hypothetical protein